MRGRAHRHAHQALRELGLAVRIPSVACRTGRLIYGQASADVALERPVEIVRREDFDADLVAQARGAASRSSKGRASTRSPSTQARVA